MCIRDSGSTLTINVLSSGGAIQSGTLHSSNTQAYNCLLYTSHLAEALNEQGFEISPRTVGSLLGEMGYSLQGTSKQKEGAQHVDRDAQFRHINDTAVAFMTDRCV